VSKLTDRFFRLPEVSGWWGYLAGGLLLAGAWFIVRPYFGIRHDSVLYTAQALARLYPDIFGRDVFFAFGGQSGFTLYPDAMAALFRWMPAGEGSKWVLFVVTFALWVAIALLFRRFLGARELLLGLAALAVAPHLYGAQQLFAFAEPFLTARSVSEALTVFALGLYVARGWLASLPLLIAAAIMHPIIALPGLSVVWLCEVQRDRRVGWVALPLLVAACLAGVAGIAPFDRLFTAFDDEWNAILTHAIVFLRNWDWTDWNIVIFDAATLLFCRRYAEGVLRRLLTAVLVTAGGGILLALVGADVLRNVLIAQLQLWRGLWLAHLFALMLLPWLGTRMVTDDRVTVLILLVASLFGIKVGAFSAVIALVVAVDRLEVIRRLLEVKYRWAIVLVAVTLVSRASVATFLAMLDALESYNLDFLSLSLALLSIPALAAITVWSLLHLQVLAGRGLSLVIGAVVFAIGFLSWDHRSEWQRFVEDGGGESRPFVDLVATDKQVYWEDGLAETWFLLRRASFHSSNQSSGIAFSRGTALEIRRRRELFEGLRFARETCRVLASLNRTDDPCVPDKELIFDLCTEAPDLDFIVMRNDIGGWATARWDWRGKGPSQRTYYLHNCSVVRQQDISG